MPNGEHRGITLPWEKDLPTVTYGERPLRRRDYGRKYGKRGIPSDMPSDWPLSPELWQQYKWWLSEQGKWFGEARAGYARKTGAIVGEQLDVDTRRLLQEMGRRGLYRSGFEQAAYTGLRGTYGRQYIQSMGDFEAKLALMLEQERAAFLKGEFDFFNELVQMRYAADLEMEIAQFKQDLQGSGWGDFFGTLLGIAISAWNPLAGLAFTGATQAVGAWQQSTEVPSMRETFTGGLRY